MPPPLQQRNLAVWTELKAFKVTCSEPCNLNPCPKPEFETHTTPEALKPGSARVHAPKAPNLKRSLLAISGAIRFDLAISCWNVACTELAALSSLEGSSTKN